MEINQLDLFQLAKRRFISRSELSFEEEIYMNSKLIGILLKQNGIEEKYCFFWGQNLVFRNGFTQGFVGESIIWG
ncbi:MAG: hypothetical protein IPJ00_09350 [Saprospirales bacterium]|nr:hypothetical protein [Saprospirales bacterium]